VTFLLRERRAPFFAACVVVLFLLTGSAQSSLPEPSGKFLIASDFHFNPFADPALVTDLASSNSRTWEAILNRSKITAYSQNHQDTNWWLLQSSLDAMRATLPHPALVMITGDLLAHGFPQKFSSATHDSDREHYRAFVLKTVLFLAWEMRKRFPHAQILITPGNNDDECGDYEVDADGPFLSDTAALARNLARDGRLTDDWKGLGSYALDPAAIPGLRILSVNSVFFSNKYQAASFAHSCAAVDSGAAARTLAWLSSSLAQAREAHKKVWLMFHIPPGIDGYATMMNYRRLSQGAPTEELCRKAIVPMWNPALTAQFTSILEEYSTMIAANFAGHNHTDDFRVMQSHGGREGFVLIDPPISPIYGQNPAFRVIDFKSDGSLADQSTYYVTNLKDARSDNPGKWAREYSFVEEWGSPQLDASSLRNIYGRIKSDPQARAQWLKLLDVSSADDTVPAAGVDSLDCAIAGLEPDSYESCYCPVLSGGASSANP
jgi:sphingomyelin phosphodiesterase acid-like 3